VKSQLDLFNNFTYFLSDPTLGDQFHQHDDRVMAGANASRTLDGSFAGRPMQTTFGVQTRYDDIALAPDRHVSAQFFFPTSAATRSAREVSASMCRTPLQWTKLAQDHGRLARRLLCGKASIPFSTPIIPAVSAPGSASPKFTMALGPFNKTEFFVGRAGTGMHSKRCPRRDHRRGSAGSRDQSCPPRHCWSAPRARKRAFAPRIVPGLDSSLSAFLLDQDSEIVFQGDAGDTAASRPSRRYGLEWTNHYRPTSWFDSRRRSRVTHARFPRLR